MIVARVLDYLLRWTLYTISVLGGVVLLWAFGAALSAPVAAAATPPAAMTTTGAPTRSGKPGVPDGGDGPMPLDKGSPALAAAPPPKAPVKKQSGLGPRLPDGGGEGLRADRPKPEPAPETKPAPAPAADPAPMRQRQSGLGARLPDGGASGLRVDRPRPAPARDPADEDRGWPMRPGLPDGGPKGLKIDDPKRPRTPLGLPDERKMLPDVVFDDPVHRIREKPGLPDGGPGGLRIDRPKPATELTTPENNRRWWLGIDHRQRTTEMVSRPEFTGNTDGIPVRVRDGVNRPRLRDDINAWEIKERQVKKELAGIRVTRNTPQLAELAEAKKKIADRRVVADRLADTSKPTGFLMGYRPNVQNGRVIVAANNPDRADNVVTYVPGLDSGLAGGVGGDLERSDRMLKAAQAADPSKQTAAVTWVDYDAPQNLGTAASAAAANRAAPTLAKFQDGLRATHQGPRSNNTVLGHSYGTTVVGKATSNGPTPLNADRVVFVASPGVGVDRASELRMPPRRVYATTDPQDDIWMGRNYLDSSRAGDPYALVHGTSPTDPRFGATVFQSDRSQVPPSGSGVHSLYWEEANPALKHMGEIIAGQEPSP